MKDTTIARWTVGDAEAVAGRELTSAEIDEIRSVIEGSDVMQAAFESCVVTALVP